MQRKLVFLTLPRRLTVRGSFVARLSPTPSFSDSRPNQKRWRSGTCVEFVQGLTVISVSSLLSRLRVPGTA